LKTLDRFIQWCRIQQVGRIISPEVYLLDIGCADGAIFRHLHHKIKRGVGVDPAIDHDYSGDSYQLIRGRFPEDIPLDIPAYDVITVLAVLEHIPLDDQPKLAKDIADHLKKDGKLIITVPSPVVDKILDVLKWIRLIDGMSLEEHYGFDIKTVPGTFTKSGLELVRHGRFQFGLNNLFVFQKK
jgi:2-polyprenyl-3-methyl-5-hydroxy-6-metoxy-1,4-benzoquinol methylase